MLAQLIAQHHQKILLFVDRVGVEEKHWKNLTKCLLEDLKAQTILQDYLEITNHLTDTQKSINFDEKLTFSEDNLSIVFSPVSSIVEQYKLEDFFKLVYKLRTISKVDHIILFATEKYIREGFIVPFLEHLAEEIVTMEKKNELKIVSRKPGGSVTKKHYNFSLNNQRIKIRELKGKETQKVPDGSMELENLGTFKIGLSEQDLVARNRLILPFEKHLQEKKETQSEGKVIYYPDADDDIDEEDPDEDLEL